MNSATATFETVDDAIPADPSIMSPANLNFTMVTSARGGTITPSAANPTPINGGNYFSFMTTVRNMNDTAPLEKNNVPAAAIAVIWPSPTTICNNSCLPRYGNFTRTPGALR